MIGYIFLSLLLIGWAILAHDIWRESGNAGDDLAPWDEYYFD